jgi:hypothetical protein
VEAVPDAFGIEAWGVRPVGPLAVISKKRSLKVSAIELKSVVKLPEEERMGRMTDSRRP